MLLEFYYNILSLVQITAPCIANLQQWSISVSVVIFPVRLILKHVDSETIKVKRNAISSMRMCRNLRFNIRMQMNSPLPSTLLKGPEYTDCIAIIRSLVLIRKQLTTLRDINGEFKAMEGENIPYGRFGFATLEEMLRHCGQFNISRQISGQVRNTQETLACPLRSTTPSAHPLQVIISARLSANDEHMAKLVQETRCKKPAAVRDPTYACGQLFNIN